MYQDSFSNMYLAECLPTKDKFID